MNLLTLKDVHSFYGKAHVLHSVSLSVRKGERVAILGRNGVGKTTVVNSFLGIARVRDGMIDLNGQRPAHIRHFSAAKAGIAVVPQGRRIVPNLTVLENLELGAAVGRKGPWNVEMVFDLFPILRERRYQLGTSMSGGQQQMLAIGRALMTNPKLLVLDEATEGLAPVIRAEIWACLARLKQDGQSILVIDKNVDALVKLADRHLILEKGRIVWEGTSGDFLASPDLKDRYLHV